MRAAISLVLVIAACDAYDRDLGPSPYLCGSTEPRCPLGYDCVLDPDGTEVCAMGTSASTLECADDGVHEPNDTLAEATPMADLGVLAICPVTDRDHFTIELSGASSDLDVTIVERAASGGPLRGGILNTGGVTIAPAAETGAPGTRRAVARDLPAGRYYVLVESGSDGAALGNNYELAVTVSAN